MLMMMVFGIRTGKDLYFEASLVIGMLGFVATVALAKFLMQGGDRMSMMDHAKDLPAWAAIAVSAFLVIGSVCATLIGAIGFARLPTFYERIHAPTLGTSWGTGGISWPR